MCTGRAVDSPTLLHSAIGFTGTLYGSVCFVLQSSQLMAKKALRVTAPRSHQSRLGGDLVHGASSHTLDWCIEYLKPQPPLVRSHLSFLSSVIPLTIHPATSEDTLPLWNCQWFLIFPFPDPWHSTLLCLIPSSVSVNLSSQASQ